MNDSNRIPPVDDNLDPTGPPIRVLVVDDEAEIRNLLKKVLSAYVVLEAENGYQALNIAQEETLDL